ncbi:hypothetical protein KBB27_01040 [Patescibacteria group bacterium]|nr:hypothetical protein [Patescibacteria group bacterium]
MSFASRGTGVLVMGIGALLLSGVLYAGIQAMDTAVTIPSNIPAEIFSAHEIIYPPGSYAALIPRATTSTMGRDQYWRTDAAAGSGNCALISERPTPFVVGMVSSTRCEILGASIEGRYVHLATGALGACTTEAFCEKPPFSVWSMYDARTAIIRSVPKPVREGGWQAIDAVRSVGLFRGIIRSTRTPDQQTDWWALTDVSGTPFWNGSLTGIDAQASEIVPLRLVSRPNGDLLLAYLAIDKENQVHERLALFSNDDWRVVMPPSALTRIWRLEGWEQGPRGWQATLRWSDESGKQQLSRVSTN